VALTRVWQPIRIGPVEIKNRVARAANTTTLFPDSVNDDFIAYHLARARGGVGLSILEAAAVHPNSQLAYAVNDNTMRGYEKLMTALRPHGMRVFQQLWHGGHNLPGFGGTMPWAPSATPSALTGIVGVPMGQQDIDELVAAFGTAARRCRDAGLDGVEIHAGHGYIIQQFLSLLTNKRADGYNGTLLERARFLIEVLGNVRAAVGRGFPIGVRMSSSAAKGGTSAADIATVAAHLEVLGLIDFLDLSYSDYFLMSGMTHSMAYPSGYQLPINEVIVKAVKVPRIVTGRYRTLEEAEQVLRDGQADLVSLVRAHIADPDIARKTRAGHVEDVRPCIACNQGCVGGLLTIGRMQCAVNPAAGYERTLDEELIARSESSKSVLIVGGGPAGMEAARIAALRGHEVTLAEASAQLGGTLRIAKRAPHMHILGDLIDWQERQLTALGVDVQLNSYMEASDILQRRPDVLIVATGAETVADGRQALTPGELPAGMNLPHVYDAAGWISAPPQPMLGKTALVFDDVGRYQAVAAADALTKAGAGITFVTSQSSYVPKMYGTGRDNESMRRLNQGAFRLLVNHQLMEIAPGHCMVRALGAPQVERIAADVVVVVTSQTPIRQLFDELRDQIPHTYLVGDALSPRDLLAAMHDGHRCARAI
jgi:2,4-dienoyl-CoA reductase-like NADH-dependent reductase (Old Yellow Enzyme family)